MLDEVFGGSEVEPRVDCSNACERLFTGIDWSRSGYINQLTFVNDALEADDGEESAGNGGGGNGTQNDQTKQTAGIAARLALEEEVGTARGRDFGGHVLRKWAGLAKGGRR
jgi:hypothetical protein